MRTTTRRAHLLRRFALIATVGVCAGVLLSASLLAGIVGLVTVVAVLLDMYLFPRPAAPAGIADPARVATPVRITVDLRRRS